MHVGTVVVTETTGSHGESAIGSVPNSIQDKRPDTTYQDFPEGNKGPSVTYHSKWKTTEPVPPSPEAFIDLLEGRTPLIMQRGFLSNEICARFEAQLEPRLTPYLHATGPAVDKVGIAQFEFQAQSREDMRNRQGDEKERYFDAVHHLANFHADLSKRTGMDIFARVLSLIRSIAPPNWEVGLATEGPSPLAPNEPQEEPRSYFAGIIRGIDNGTPIHCDWVPYDLGDESWSIKAVTHQAVFNLYLTTPTTGDPQSGSNSFVGSGNEDGSSSAEGGSTTIYDVQWTPEAMAWRDPKSYGYDEGLLLRRAEGEWQWPASLGYFKASKEMKKGPNKQDWYFGREEEVGHGLKVLLYSSTQNLQS